MTPHKRRWYQFSLRTFFVLVTLVCVGFGWWVHWSREWIRQRKEAIDVGHAFSGALRAGDEHEARLPISLRLFGADEERAIARPADSPLTLEQIERLFPEAKVWTITPR